MQAGLPLLFGHACRVNEPSPSSRRRDSRVKRFRTLAFRALLRLVGDLEPKAKGKAPRNRTGGTGGRRKESGGEKCYAEEPTYCRESLYQQKHSSHHRGNSYSADVLLVELVKAGQGATSVVDT